MFIQFFIVALLVVNSTPKKNYKMIEDLNYHFPKVKAYDCTDCAFNDGYSFFCMETTATLNIGWQFVQSYNDIDTTKLYFIQFQPYMQPDMVFHPTFTIHNLFHWESTITVKQFKIGPYAEMRYSYGGWLCFNLGWKTE